MSAVKTDQLRDLVELALRDGHLWGARPGNASKTLTVRGKRRYRIRLQCDIFRALQAPESMLSEYFYLDLVLDIQEYVAELRTRYPRENGGETK